MKYLLLCGVPNSGKTTLLTQACSTIFGGNSVNRYSYGGAPNDYYLCSPSSLKGGCNVFLGTAGDDKTTIETNIFLAHNIQNASGSLQLTGLVADYAIFPVSIQNETTLNYYRSRFYNGLWYLCRQYEGIRIPSSQDIFVVQMPYMCSYSLLSGAEKCLHHFAEQMLMQVFNVI